MTKEEEEEEKILTKEIESWNSFEYALKGEDSILFKKMLNECRKEVYTKAFNAKGEYNSTTESLFIALIFQQQKMISQLIDRLSRYKQRARKSNLGNS